MSVRKKRPHLSDFTKLLLQFTIDNPDKCSKAWLEVVCYMVMRDLEGRNP